MTYVIYTKTGCENCLKAKALLRGEEIVAINCDMLLENDRENFVKSMQLKMNKQLKEFPLIFLDDTYLGGYKDLVNHLSFEMIDDDF